MNTKTLKALTVTASLIAGLGAASPAMATNTGVQVLGLNATDADIFTYTCPLAYPLTRARVFDLPSLNILARMQVAVDGALFQTDNAGFPNGEGGGSSPNSNVIGAGQHAATFKKTAVGGEIYSGQVECYRLFPAPFVFNPVLTRVLNK